MLSLLKSEFIKLKWLSSFKTSFFVTILFFITPIIFIVFMYLSTRWIVWWYFDKILNVESMYGLFSFLNLFLIISFAFIVDSIVWVDKQNWAVLYAKNIRAKYFWAKLIISIIILAFILLLSTIIIFWFIYFFANWLENETFLSGLKDFLMRDIFIFLSFLPLLALFVLSALFDIKAIVIWSAIVFFSFANTFFGGSQLLWDVQKYIDYANDYTMLWNFKNINKNIYLNKAFITENQAPKYYDNFSLEDLYWKKYAPEKRPEKITYLSSYQNFWTILQYFVNFKNRDFNVWFFSFILFWIVGTLYMQKREISS